MQAPFKSITSYTQFAVKTQPPTFQNPYGKRSHLISLPSDAATSKKNKPHAMHLLETQHNPALHIALSFKDVLLPAWRWKPHNPISRVRLKPSALDSIPLNEHIQSNLAIT